MSTKSIQRARAELKRRGWLSAIVEYWNEYDHTRHDLFGFIDIIALSPEGIMAIQAGGGAAHAAHKRKIMEAPAAEAWLKSGGIIEIWSFRKLKVKRGGKLKTWQPRIERITDLTGSQTPHQTHVEAILSTPEPRTPPAGYLGIPPGRLTPHGRYP